LGFLVWKQTIWQPCLQVSPAAAAVASVNAQWSERRFGNHNWSQCYDLKKNISRPKNVGEKGGFFTTNTSSL
jgi:hypothetical protein